MQYAIKIPVLCMDLWSLLSLAISPALCDGTLAGLPASPGTAQRTVSMPAGRAYSNACGKGGARLEAEVAHKGQVAPNDRQGNELHHAGEAQLPCRPCGSGARWGM